MKMPKVNPMSYIKPVFDKVRVQLTSVYAKLDDERVSASDAAGVATVTLNGRARVEAVDLDPAALEAAASDPAALKALVEGAVVEASRKAYLTSEALRKEMSAKATGGILPKGIDMPLEAI